MNIQTLIILFITLFFSYACSAQQGKYKKEVVLRADCFFEQKKRVIVDSLNSQVATITKKGNSFLLLIKDKKYLACNLPDSLKSKTALISGYVLQSLQTEKLLATPLKITKAFVPF